MFPAKKGDRECDYYDNGIALKKAFDKFCANCNRNCPMGCILIKDKDAHMQCFAEWAMSKFVFFQE